MLCWLYVCQGMRFLAGTAVTSVGGQPHLGAHARPSREPANGGHDARGTICADRPYGGLRGCSSMAEHQLPKLNMRVRFPSSAPCDVSGHPGRPNPIDVGSAVRRSAGRSGWSPGALVALGWVEDELPDEFAGDGVDDADVKVLDEDDDAGSGVGSVDADGAEPGRRGRPSALRAGSGRLPLPCRLRRSPSQSDPGEVLTRILAVRWSRSCPGDVVTAPATAQPDPTGFRHDRSLRPALPSVRHVLRHVSTMS